MKLRKALYLSPFTEVAGKGRGVFGGERDCSESKSRVLDLEDICRMREPGFAGRIGAKNNDERTSEVRKSATALHIVHSISNRNPDKTRVRVCEVDRYPQEAIASKPCGRAYFALFASSSQLHRRPNSFLPFPMNRQSQRTIALPLNSGIFLLLLP
jgi:hypothetical protein